MSAAPIVGCGPPVEVEVDLVADHRRARRAGDDVRRVVVAEHRQRDEDCAPQDARLRERERHRAKRGPGARTEVTCRFQVAAVDAIERGEEWQDQEWDVAVDEGQDDGQALPPSQSRGSLSTWVNIELFTQPSSCRRFTQASIRIM